MKKVILIVFFMFPVISQASSAVTVWNQMVKQSVAVEGGKVLKPGERQWFRIGVSGQTDGYDTLNVRVGSDVFSLVDSGIRCPSVDDVVLDDWAIMVFHNGHYSKTSCIRMADDAVETHSMVVVSDLDESKGLHQFRYYSTGGTGTEPGDISGYIDLSKGGVA